MLDITKVVHVSGDEYNGVIAIEPLESGHAHTLGNSLRRVLLNNLPGAAVTSVKIKGAPHQFMTLPGMKEDVVDFVLNLKKVRFVMHSDVPVVLHLQAKGPGPITAGMIAAQAQVEVVNKDLVLCHLSDDKAQIQADITVSTGVGYETIEDRATLDPDTKASLGEIVVDALYSPVTRVNYTVENTRVGRITTYDRLVMDIVTDGTVSAHDALKQAAKILANDFALLADSTLSQREQNAPASVLPKDSLQKAVLIEELDLQPKIVNRLKENNLVTAEDVVRAGRDELLKMPNFGEKSLKELEAKLEERGYTL